ncbi:hypothetical protein GCM10009836_34100 [Pseudonocardia ailaonensis]|uniref:Short-chain dehydrogenase n=1 Tax=Pseudonocardia ailaonensis TaxID=367279 RepID=A0ABN2N5F8_9PSEU
MTAETRSWAGRTAVITGGARGIGLAVARRLSEAGGAVVIVDVDPDVVAKATADVPALVGITGDVRDPERMAGIAEEVRGRFGGVDLLHANAGVTPREPGERLWEIPDESWQWVFGVNLFGVINTLRAFVPLVLERASSQVLVTASYAAYFAAPISPEYFTSKPAVASLAEALDAQFRREGLDVGVTTLVPSLVTTDLGRWREDRWSPETLLGSLPNPRMSPEGVADQVIEALDRRQRYVFTHPESFELARSRFAALEEAVAEDLARFGSSESRGAS